MPRRRPSDRYHRKTVTIPSDVMRELDGYCKRHNKTVSAVVTEAVEKYLRSPEED